jgi:hypothetical protein
VLGRLFAATLALLGCSERAAPPGPRPATGAAKPPAAPVVPIVVDKLDCREVATKELIPLFFPGSRVEFDRNRDEYGTKTDCYYTMGTTFGHVRIDCENKPLSDDEVRARIEAFTEATPVEGIGRGAHQFDKRMIRFWHRVAPSCTIEVGMSPDDPKLRDFAHEIDARITALGYSVGDPSPERP